MLDGRCAGTATLKGGKILACLVDEPGIPATLVGGLSESNLPGMRQAFLTILSLILWGSSNHTEGSVRLDGGSATLAAIQRGAESVLALPDLLLQLLRIAEHGEGPSLRAKAFLTLRIVFEVAQPEVLLFACRGRLLSLLARSVGGLAPRADYLPLQQRYLYHSCLGLAQYLCGIPEQAARQLVTDLQSDAVFGTVRGGDGRGSVGICEGSRPSLKAFLAVPNLINSPLLRQRTVTSVFVSDIAACLTLCQARGEELRRLRDQQQVRGLSEVGDDPEVQVLLPLVEAMAHHAPQALLCCREAVAFKLLPALCGLLRGRSGDTRALTLVVLRIVLPRVLKTPPGGQGCGDLVNSEGEEVSDQVVEDAVRIVITNHLIPKVGHLFSDQSPVPQLVVHLLIDLGLKWGELGLELLAQG
ncbi:unnamed protein product, partial [Choristocarpus tenellus]